MSDFKIGDDQRRRATDQLEKLREANEGRLAWDTEAPADFTYLYDPDHVLVLADDRADLEGALRRLDRAFERVPLDPDDDGQDGEDETLFRYLLPDRREGESIGDVIDELEADAGLARGRITPDHWIHIAPTGKGTACPATEPEETGLCEPWPPVYDDSRGKGVQVVVVDTGWHPPAATNPATPWLEGVDGDDENNASPLREYAGHGTHIAGVVRCLAPATSVFVEGFAVNGIGGGGILESQMVRQLREAMAHKPQVISMSAGLRTRHDLPSLVFQRFHDHHLKDADCVLVAAAGNDTSPAPFWPAAFDWAVGVGALDRDLRVSDFSNYGVSADVYTVGRNIVNAFPDGEYVCFETPHKGDVREFKTGLARWSGTSFSTPIVAGLIAAEISASGADARTARDTVLARAVYRSDPTVGPIKVLDWNDF
ncbi:S8/S53 family peptidase [Nocardioides bigeumensis]|uniref:S8 family peptidase n=1 Tax=Nocardioides bigeumensis TaxID=433657 RepID=UPI0031D5CC60